MANVTADGCVQTGLQDPHAEVSTFRGEDGKFYLFCYTYHNSEWRRRPLSSFSYACLHAIRRIWEGSCIWALPQISPHYFHHQSGWIFLYPFLYVALLCVSLSMWAHNRLLRPMCNFLCTWGISRRRKCNYCPKRSWNPMKEQIIKHVKMLHWHINIFSITTICKLPII